MSKPEIISLPFEKWSLVEPIVTGEFGNLMPVTPKQAGFMTALDGGKLAGFIPVETLFHLHGEWIAPEYRRTRLAWDLMRETALCIPKGFSAIVMTEPSTTTRLLERLGARHMGNYDVYRKDY